MHRYRKCIPIGWDTPALCANLVLFASHNACSELTNLLPRVKKVQAHLYKVLCERMPYPFSAWVKLVKDRLAFFTEQCNAEVGFARVDLEFCEFVSEMIGFKEFCSVLLTQCPSVRIRVIKI